MSATATTEPAAAEPADVLSVVDDTHKRILAVVESTSAPFVRRARVARGMMLATLAGEHVLLLGPPGTAKSAITRHFVSHFDGAKHFDWLLTKFSQPEEIFGPVSLKAMKEGRYERVPTGKLPEATFAFLDEIFKANSSILNSLLTAANERQWHDGVRVHDIPLKTIIGASNELPSDETLEAFFDRFLLRYHVQNVATSAGAFRDVIGSSTPVVQTTVSDDVLADAMDQVDKVDVSGVVGLMWELSSHLSTNDDIVVSDRRWKKAVKIVKAEAWLSGYNQAEAEDLMVLRDVLWSDTSEIEAVHKAVNARSVGVASSVFESMDALTSRFGDIKANSEDQKLANFIRDSRRVYSSARSIFDECKSVRTKQKISVRGKAFQNVLKEAQEMVTKAVGEDFNL